MACGSSGNGLIPAAQAGPLQSDIEAVEKAAEEGNGNCSATEAALLKTDRTSSRCPLAWTRRCGANCRLGIENLHKVALEACAAAARRTDDRHDAENDGHDHADHDHADDADDNDDDHHHDPATVGRR